MPGRDYQSSSETKEKFVGKELDVETEWVHFPAQPYLPSLGRWLIVEPLLENYPSLSGYSYALNNPLRFVDPDGRLLYDKQGNRINLNQAINLISQAVGNFYSGKQSEALYGFIAKREIWDIFDTENWYYGFGKGELLIGSYYDIYDKSGKFITASRSMIINLEARGGYWASSLIEKVGWTKKGKEIYRFQILDEKDQPVFTLIGTEEELNRFLAQFGRTLRSAPIYYQDGKIYGNLPSDTDSKKDNENNIDGKKKKKNSSDNSWWEGWGAQNQNSPR